MLCFILPEVGSLKFHRYSQEKTMNWLKKKVVVIAVLSEIQTYEPFLFFKLQNNTKISRKLCSMWKCTIYFTQWNCIEFFLLVGVGGEDGRCTQKEKYLCG